MKKRLLLVVVVTTVVAALAGSTVLAQGPDGSSGSIPFRPVNPDYYKIKTDIDTRALQQSSAQQPNSSAPLPALSTPASFVSWAGQAHGSSSPSDATGAIGPDRYIETVNTRVGVYNRSGGLISQASQSSWTGISAANGDAAVMWSPHDNRFFASMLYISGSTYRLIYGFSKTATPTSARNNWCFYNSTFGGRYGSNIPDYPKLGDTADFMLMGVNVFNNAGTAYLGSDIAWVKKPAVGNISACPAQSSLATGTIQNIKNADGTQASTPNPAKQTDSSSTGYVVADEDPGSGSSTNLAVYTVTKSGSGTPVLSAPTAVTVGSYAYPPSAPQSGTSSVLDTLDARLMSAWAAPDPSRGGAVAVWTGHTVAASAGGLGAEFRWYEINPTTGAVYQSGKVQSSSLYVFMGAIAPDRNGASGTFGSNAAMALNTSSSSTTPAAAMVSVVGGVQSGIVTIATSPASDNDFTCTAPYGPPCRWGDYSGASPDPASTTTGQVWMTAMTNGSSGNPSWTTRNWGATP